MSRRNRSSRKPNKNTSNAVPTPTPEAKVNTTSDTGPETPSDVDLKQCIENKMERKKYNRDYRQNKFVSLAYVRTIFSDQNLKASLSKDITTLKRENDEVAECVDISTLVAYVRESATKLYGVLLLVGKPQLIVKLLTTQPPVTDKIFEGMDSTGDGPYCPMEYLKKSQLLCDIAEKVFIEQWRIPPVFRRDTHFKFPKECFKNIQFPFVRKPQALSEGSGNYGVVSRALIAQGHLIAEKYQEGGGVAWKSIRRADMDEERMLREVKLVRDRSHANVVTFFASFWAGPENPLIENDPNECLHMFFQYTSSGNMHNWLRLSETPKKLQEENARQDFIYQSVLGVISGVAYIHREIDSLIAYHHDLKPKNILLFEGETPVWKICDFGHANTKDAGGSSGTMKGSKNEFGTWAYLPPEYYMKRKEPKEMKYGRPFDVFSLGCILLDLATILKLGWTPEGVPKFIERRINNTDRPYDGPEAQRRKDDSFFNSPKVVEEWRNHLKSGDTTNRYNSLLDLIEKMTQGESSRRIFAWEAEVGMYEICHENTSEKELKKQLLVLLEKVIQKSSTPLNKLDGTHNNPYKSALDEGKHWQLRILKANNWSYEDPQSGVEHTGEGLFYSTLTNSQYTKEFERHTLFGRHDLDGKILHGFRPKGGSRVVGLYGLSGMGKSHIAFHYAARFTGADNPKDRRHAFWVNASNMTRYRESMELIARRVGLGFSSPEDACRKVKAWLCNEKNEPWFMVLDGVDDDKTAIEVRGLLPEDRGQALITTKNKGILVRFEKDRSTEFKFFVGEPSMADRRGIFDWHNNDTLADAAKMEAMLESLFLPVRVRSKAWSLETYATTTRQGYKDMLNTMDRGQKYAPFCPKTKVVLTNLFRPIIPQDPRKGCYPWPSHELKLLGLMSCLNIDLIEQNLLEADSEPKDHGKLREMLGVLKNCSYIGERRSTESGSSTYSMHRFVQMAVHQCIQETPGLGLVALLECHQAALASLLCIYNQEKTDGTTQQSSYYLKRPLIPHFEPFVEFAKKHRRIVDSLAKFKRADTLTHSAITFSYVLLEEGRHDDVACLLDFILKLKGDKGHLVQLRRILAKAYTLAPLAAYSSKCSREAEKLLQQETEQSCESARDLQSWLFLIDLARLYSTTERPRKALGVLASFGGFRFQIYKGLPRIAQENSTGMAENEQRRIALLGKIETAYAYAVRANLQDAQQTAKNNGKQGNKAIKNNANRKTSKKLIEEAKTAYSEWFPEESQAMADHKIEQGIIMTLITIREKETLKSARDKLDQIAKHLEINTPSRPGIQKRLRDTETWIAQLDLEIDESLASTKKAVKSLERALEYYRANFAKRDGEHDPHTRNCAHLLKTGYEKIDRDQSKRADLTEYRLEQLAIRVSFDDDVDEPKPLLSKVIQAVILLCLVLVFKGNLWPSLDLPWVRKAKL